MSRFALRAAALLAVAGLALAACGNDKGAAPGLRAVKGVAGDLLKRGKDKAPPTPLTREQLAGFNTPMLMAEVKTANVLLYLVPFGQNGGVETWATSDDRTLSFRDGVLVATRGLGPDIMQSEVPSRAQLAAGRGSHGRAYYYLDGDDKIRRQSWSCTLSDRGSEAITVVGLQYPTRHVVESCTGEGGTITNEYWFESGGYIRKSRELIMPEWGYAEVSRVVDKP
ncbi:MAG TPA: YjbF family lipoprotein [Gemmobacter sp.]|nr:YjbF family lipoprotein [Gemmobacter sp.]